NELSSSARFLGPLLFAKQICRLEPEKLRLLAGPDANRHAVRGTFFAATDEALDFVRGEIAGLSPQLECSRLDPFKQKRFQFSHFDAVDDFIRRQVAIFLRELRQLPARNSQIR